MNTTPDQPRTIEAFIKSINIIKHYIIHYTDRHSDKFTRQMEVKYYEGNVQDSLEGLRRGYPNRKFKAEAVYDN